MKECVYGWYPPAREILKTYEGKQPMDAYTKECFYKHSKSRYADKPGVSTPDDPLNNVQWRASPQQVRKYKSWSAASRTSQAHSRSKSASINLEIRGQGHTHVRPKSSVTPVERKEPTLLRSRSATDTRATPDEKLFAPTPDPRLLAPTADVKVLSPTPDINYPSPAPPGGNYMRNSISQASRRSSKAWNTRTEETNHIPDFQAYLKDMSDQESQRLSPHPPSPAHSHDDRHITISEHDQHIDRDFIATPQWNGVEDKSTQQRQDRIRSATMYRPRMCTHRPVKSASSVRRTPVVVTDVPHHDDTELSRDPTEERILRKYQLDQMVRELTRDEETPVIDEPGVVPARPVILLPDPDEELGVEKPLDYDEQLTKHGWRMQVHGDPLNLKRPCVAKRLAFTEKVPVRVIPPDPPKARSECYDTFFLNTIPRKPMSFTINQDWASEVLHAKRMQLQKRDGDTYKYKTANFSFAY